jgi:hypothetical protein
LGPRTTLTDAITRWPTPSARDWKSGGSNLLEEGRRPLNEVATNGQVALRLNPRFVEWMMSWPDRWTETVCTSSATESSPIKLPTPSPSSSTD